LSQTPAAGTGASARKEPDVVIGPEQYGQTFRLSVGQTVAVKPPVENAEWTVDYAGEVLSALTPQEKMRAPGPEGWLFEAKAPGQTDVMFTSGPNAATGPPARFTVTVQVERSAPRR
jgi:hypothetical protein